MAPVTFEQGIALKKLSENTFRSLQTPWTWPNSPVVPGGILMALAANAAFQTCAPGFALDTLSCHFLAAPKAAVPFDISVQRLSDGGRFCSRVATLSQGDSLKVHVTCSFVRAASMTGPSMQHTISRQSHQTLDAITLDDLAVTRSDIGPYMRFQRLPLLYTGPGPTPFNPPPESLLYTSVAQMSPLGAFASMNPEILSQLALVALSDYHILDCPPTVHGLAVGTPGINSREPTVSAFNFLTSLNHSIRFHTREGIRADELVYMEARSPWARGRRAQVESRMFAQGGGLLASCVQECYFVVKEGMEGREREYVMEKEVEGTGRGRGSRL